MRPTLENLETSFYRKGFAWGSISLTTKTDKFSGHVSSISVCREQGLSCVGVVFDDLKRFPKVESFFGTPSDYQDYMMVFEISSASEKNGKLTLVTTFGEVLEFSLAE